MRNHLIASRVAMGAALLSCGFTAQSVYAQDNTPEEASSGDAEPIVVLGTRRADRSVTETSVPVDVFDSSMLETQAPSDMVSVLRNIIPSFNVGRFALSDGSSVIRPPTLRGLPPDEILVLVNGKRFHRAALVQIFGGALASGSQGVDISQIPAVAVDSIEVLRDGAAAQYGSDAIAGVINYNLKRETDDLSGSVRYGQFYRGDGENFQFNANVGLPLGPDGFLNVAGDYIRSEVTNPGGQRIGAFYLSQERPDLDIPNPVQATGDPESRAVHVFANAGLNVSDSSEVYMFANYGWSRTRLRFNWRQPVDVVGLDRDGVTPRTYGAASWILGTVYLDQLPNGNWDADGATFDHVSLFPSGFAPLFEGRVADTSITGGYKGEFDFGLTYDLSASYGQNRIDYNIDNTLNASLGPDTPTSFYAGRLQQAELNFNADFVYPWEVGLASPVNVAFGGERRREVYTITPGDADSYALGPYYYQVVERADGTTFENTNGVGSNGFPGFSPSSATNSPRQSWALYLDLEADIVDALTVGGAVRHENFSDFGSTTNVKGTLRLEASDALAFRAAASTGFRAPTPGQLFTTNISTGFDNANPTESGLLPVTNPASILFGAEQLKPETSVNLSAGLVFTPSSDLTVTLDAYQITVDDRIGTSATFRLSDGFDITGDGVLETEAQLRDSLRAAGLPNWATLSNIRYFTNAFKTRTRGVDLVLTHNAYLGDGRLTSTLSGNYNKTTVLERDPIVIDNERTNNIEQSLPKIRANLTETYSNGRLTVIARAAYADGFTAFSTPGNGGAKDFGSQINFDLEVAYELTDNLRLAVGAENIFNNYPDKDLRCATGVDDRGNACSMNWFPQTDADFVGDRYSWSSPFGFNGGFWYARLGFDF